MLFLFISSDCSFLLLISCGSSAVVASSLVADSSAVAASSLVADSSAVAASSLVAGSSAVAASSLVAGSSAVATSSLVAGSSAVATFSLVGESIFSAASASLLTPKNKVAPTKIEAVPTVNFLIEYLFNVFGKKSKRFFEFFNNFTPLKFPIIKVCP